MMEYLSSLMSSERHTINSSQENQASMFSSLLKNSELNRFSRKPRDLHIKNGKNKTVSFKSDVEFEDVSNKESSNSLLGRKFDWFHKMFQASSGNEDCTSLNCSADDSLTNTDTNTRETLDGSDSWHFMRNLLPSRLDETNTKINSSTEQKHLENFQWIAKLLHKTSNLDSDIKQTENIHCEEKQTLCVAAEDLALDEPKCRLHDKTQVLKKIEETRNAMVRNAQISLSVQYIIVNKYAVFNAKL